LELLINFGIADGKDLWDFSIEKRRVNTLATP
jgi:hypothetical protein